MIRSYPAVLVHLSTLFASVVDPDPDPVRSETFGWIRIRIRYISLRIRIRAARIRKEFQIKLFCQAEKNAQFLSQNGFFFNAIFLKEKFLYKS